MAKETPRFIHLSREHADIRVDQISEIIDPPVDAPEGMDAEQYREPNQERMIVMANGREYEITRDELAQIREALRQSNTL